MRHLLIPTALIATLFAVPASARQTLDFKAFDATIGTVRVDDSVEVAVALGRPGLRLGARADAPCFQAPEGLVVTLDGAPMRLAFAGGKARGMMMSGVNFGGSECASATWLARIPAGGDAPAVSTVEFALNGGTAQMKIEHLLAPRRTALKGGGLTVKPGAPVTLEWAPASDRPLRAPRAAQLHVYRPNTFSKTVPLRSIDGHRFSATLPVVPEGEAFLDLMLGEALMRPRIAACTALRSCTAGAVNSMPLKVTVAK